MGFFFSSIICLTIMCGQPQIYCSEVLPHLCLCMFKALYRRTDGRAYIQRDTIRNICRQTESERDRQRPGHRETHRRGLENQRKKKGMIQIQWLRQRQGQRVSEIERQRGRERGAKSHRQWRCLRQKHWQSGRETETQKSKRVWDRTRLMC